MDSDSRLGHSPLLLTRIAMFVAVGIAVGLALSMVPNVELVTAVCFAAGFMLGPGAGLLVGGLTEALFAGFHPMGSSFGLLLAGQVAGMALAGLLGALAGWLTRGRMRGAGFATIVVALGLLATIIFDVITNLVFPVTAGFSVSQTMVSLVAAVPFVVIHWVSNTAVFLFIVVPLLPRLQKALSLP